MDQRGVKRQHLAKQIFERKRAIEIRKQRIIETLNMGRTCSTAVAEVNVVRDAILLESSGFEDWKKKLNMRGTENTGTEASNIV